MKRARHLILVSHCVLNQNSVVHPLARARGALRDAALLVIQSGAGIYQLPCPEMAFGGLAREPASNAEYDTPAYHELCRTLVNGVLADIRPMLDDGCSIVGVLAIRSSPTCSIREPRGHLMAELMARPELAGVPALDIPEDCCADDASGEAPSVAHSDFWANLRAMVSAESAD